MAYDFKNLKEKLLAIDEWLKREYSTLRTGIATPAVLDSIQIESYGSKMHLNQVATIGIEGPRSLRITPYDKSQTKEIEKAIVAGNLGVSASSDDKGVRVSFPELTTERRTLLIKTAKEKLEDARKNVRGARDEAMKEIDAKEEEGGMGEDDKNRFKKEAQKIIDEANKKLEENLEKKEKEINS